MRLTVFSQEPVFHGDVFFSLWMLKAVKHFLPLLMDFYSTFQSSSTFIALPLPSEILIHCRFLSSLRCRLSVGPYVYPLRHGWYLNMNVALSGLFLNISLAQVVTMCRSVWALLVPKGDLWLTVPSPHPHPPWVHLCSGCLLWFWVRFNGWKSGMVSDFLVWAKICVLGTRVCFQGHTNTSSLAPGSHRTGSKLLSCNTQVYDSFSIDSLPLLTTPFFLD